MSAQTFEYFSDLYWRRVSSERILREWREAGFSWASLIHSMGAEPPEEGPSEHAGHRRYHQRWESSSWQLRLERYVPTAPYPLSSQVQRSASDGEPGGLGAPNSGTRLPEICDDCDHPIRFHGKYGCEYERGDAWVTGTQGDQSTVLMAQGPCGCQAVTFEPIETYPDYTPERKRMDLMYSDHLESRQE